jgi:nitroreductase
MTSGKTYRFVPYVPSRLPEAQMRERAKQFCAGMETRRSVRSFAREEVPLDVIDECIRAAGLAPSGANRQPWTFVVVTDPAVKRKVREAAEAEEKELYGNRLSDEWREALEPLGTDWEKPALEDAPALIALFRHAFDFEGEKKRTNYYTQESVGIALGFLITALHQCGLATLTHTPSPMGFLGDILGRPENERAYVLLPVGYPAPDCSVPELKKKSLDEIRVRI